MNQILSQKNDFDNNIIYNDNLKTIKKNYKSKHSFLNNYSTSKLSATNTYETHEDEFKVVGLIEINSISINYPIISRVTNELLKIAPCRFFGPMPNEIRKYVRCWA